jgi:hypothetical protein
MAFFFRWGITAATVCERYWDTWRHRLPDHVGAVCSLLCPTVRRRSIYKLEFLELLLDVVRQRHFQSGAIGAYTSCRCGANSESNRAIRSSCVRHSRLHLGPYASALGSRVSSTVEPHSLVAEQHCAFGAAFEPGAQFCSLHRVAFEPYSQLRSVTHPHYAATDIAAHSFDDSPAHWQFAGSYIGTHCQSANCRTYCVGCAVGENANCAYSCAIGPIKHSHNRGGDSDTLFRAGLHDTLCGARECGTFCRARERGTFCRARERGTLCRARE